jgi:hypothetical protein
MRNLFVFPTSHRVAGAGPYARRLDSHFSPSYPLTFPTSVLSAMPYALCPMPSAHTPASRNA